MKTYEFTLILADAVEMTEQLADSLYEAGCSDGTPFSGNGVAGIGFSRAAVSLEEAITQAIENVEKAGWAVARVELDSDELATLKT